MKKRHMRGIISVMLCVAMVLSLLTVSSVEASEQGKSTEPALEYVVVDKPSVTTPGTQKIVVGYNKDRVLTGAVLRYKNTSTNEEYSVEASEIQESAAVFEMTYEDESWTGTYSIEDITYTADGKEYSLNFKKCGIEGKFAVNQICETDPDAVVEGEKTEENTDISDADISFTAITQDGTVHEEDSIADVINDAIDTQSADSQIATYAGRTSTRLVVVLDPGHGGFDPGTSGNGANEKTLTLKIAKYCKEALEKNGRIQVYMTRESDTSVGGATDVSSDLRNRITFAVSKNADLFVSIHLNSAGASAYGAEVYYPNSNYRSDIGQEGQKLASSIQKQLVSLGLYNRGVKINNSANSKYPDGSVQDYYYVIQQSKRNGFPGIIVEHAFLSNASDYQKYLSSDEKLKALGEADARGILEYINNNVQFGNWQQNGSQWKFVYYNGKYAVNCWEKIDGFWYHFDGNGIMQTGWLNLSGTWYYLNPNGAMQTGWLKLNNVWYYLNASGVMQVGWLNLGGTWYYLNGGGVMQTGWLNLNGTWYYLNPNGAMQTGWLKLDGIWYYFNTSGARISNCWYWVGNQCYYFDKDGKMASDTWVGEYYVNVSGAWEAGKKKENNESVQKPEQKPAMTPAKAQWVNTSGRWWYRHADGSCTKSGWEYIENEWYYFDKDGWMTTGYQNVDGTWYYLKKNISPQGVLTYTGVTPIMGSSDISGDKNTVVNKMVKMYQKSGRTYPAAQLANGGAASLEQFCQIVYDEAVKEGVKPEIVFGQAMKETGYLQFGGSVKIEQFNFAGLGATDVNPTPASFPDVATGIRAQVQHLKAYASKDNLTQANVDPRFSLVTRGSAMYVEWLGQKENPNGRGWATAWNYGISLMNQYVRPMYSL